tara:strand:+ start:341 stop:475 length:135 start_codon:yes stop_codon:yes gene_type:complete
MVVRVSIVNDSDIYRLPNRKLKTVKQNTKKRKSAILIEILINDI